VMLRLRTTAFIFSLLIPFSAELLSSSGIAKRPITKYNDVNPFIREGRPDKWLKPYPLSHLRGGSDNMEVKEATSQSTQIESFRFDGDTKARAIRQLQLDSCQRSMDSCFQR
jgi:hypothetical protein